MRAQSRWAAVNRSLGRLKPDLFLKVYKTLVRPLLEVNIQAAYPNMLQDSCRLESVQRRATKTARSLRDIPYQIRLEQLDLFSLYYRRLRGELILLRKVFTYPDHPLRGLFQLASTVGLRGHHLKLACNYSRTNVRKHAFANRVCDPWNALPAEVVSCNSVVSFKRKLDEYMLANNNPYNNAPLQIRNRVTE